VGEEPVNSMRDAAPPAGAPKIGDVLAGKYTVREVLGTGGMGIVLAARHDQLGDQVAIKVLLPKALRDREAIGRFIREARTAVKIKSDHVVRVLDIGALDTGVPFIVMELLTGQDLGRILRKEGRQPVAESVDWVLQACVAIAEAHALGIVHRDLKPSNLFLATRSDGTAIVKVVDFGISKALEADLDEPRDTELTDTQATFGSPAYMSPEQIRSSKNVDYRTDIWSLGVILYELLVGDTPFQGETSSGVLAAISADPAPRLRALRPDAPAALEEALLVCLTKDVAHRYATVAELAEAIAPFGLPDSYRHLERVHRLTTAGSGKLPAPRRSQSGSSVSPPAAFAATEKPWTTGTAPSGRGRWTSVSLLVAGVLLGGAVTLGLKWRARPPAAATPSPSAPSTVSPVATVSALPPPVAPAEVEPPVTAPQVTLAAAPDAGILRPPPTPGTIRRPKPKPKQAPGAVTTDDATKDRE
jgi:eukaryotic-like serine/threonine-protein kinase